MRLKHSYNTEPHISTKMKSAGVNDLTNRRTNQSIMRNADTHNCFTSLSSVQLNTCSVQVVVVQPYVACAGAAPDDPTSNYFRASECDFFSSFQQVV
jgi:hypothetical protein